MTNVISLGCYNGDSFGIINSCLGKKELTNIQFYVGQLFDAFILILGEKSLLLWSCPEIAFDLFLYNDFELMHVKSIGSPEILDTEVPSVRKGNLLTKRNGLEVEIFKEMEATSQYAGILAKVITVIMSLVIIHLS